MFERSLDMSPGESPPRQGKKTFGRQPGCSSPPDGFGCRAWRWQLPALIRVARRGVRFVLLALGCAAALCASLPAAEPAAAPKATNAVATARVPPADGTNAAAPKATNSGATARAPAGDGTNAAPRFEVKAYVVKCDPLIFTNAPTSMLSEFTGTNVGPGADSGSGRNRSVGLPETRLPEGEHLHCARDDHQRHRHHARLPGGISAGSDLRQAFP